MNKQKDTVTQMLLLGVLQSFLYLPFSPRVWNFATNLSFAMWFCLLIISILRAKRGAKDPIPV